MNHSAYISEHWSSSLRTRMFDYLCDMIARVPRSSAIGNALLDRLSFWDPKGLATSSGEASILEGPAAEAMTAVTGEAGHVTVAIRGEILGVPAGVATAIKEAKTVHLQVDSFGGSSRASWELVSLLEGKGATCHVSRIAGSAASTVACLCEGRRTIHEGGFLMLHANKMLLIGTGERLAEAAMLCRTFDREEIRRLARRTGRPRREVARWMEGEDSWLCSHECVELGLMDAITDTP